ncbi:MAG: twin-arginine translocase subunit TatC [Acidobacteria bacterium]|nr:twin-arginine translocase subunit TatC [Acidobacteriota bacterium]
MAVPDTPPNQMSFWEHLQELRVRIVRSLGIIVAAFALTYAFRFRIWTWVQKPFLESMARQTHKPISELQPWAFTDLSEPFFSLMRLSLWAAAFLAAPFLFYQLWAFIRPGLYERERRLVVPFVFITSAMFLGGAAFAYFQAFKFLGDILFQEAAQAGLRTNLHIDSYLDLFLYTLLITGVMFELPVLFYFLARFRIVTARWMLKYWRHATVIILIVSAFFTPGDVVVTTIFFTVILEALYFASVAVAWFAEPRAPRPDGTGSGGPGYP